jgi:hypothetical protein
MEIQSGDSHLQLTELFKGMRCIQYIAIVESYKIKIILYFNVNTRKLIHK